ncbi:Crp/Fnr family transcriptional regulator [Waterburya agarophytonicola K14]|uniref:Crp/Fnr family transcriptional regulator n=1 Tax=Waterburya agarophytonicola KI4 TaxID=2874699 RepID=A0A964BS07_9CYAN|nr:Crp/Fnr family transcriptional regulator [Waterburya agarophytonicola]MCC0177727.1 Crp/Fnr family transcriptional regulator [Waterburya agarophytonicola KI4]
MNRHITRFFQQGDVLPEESNHLWLIIDGVIKSYTVDQQGKTIILGFWGTQEVVGKPLSNMEPHFLQCMKDVQAIAIPTIQWHTLSGNLLNRIKQIQELSDIIRNPQTSDRLWLFLQWLGIKFGRDIPEGRLIDFKITELILAHALGMNEITVGEILDQFERENLILQPENQHIILLQN